MPLTLITNRRQFFAFLLAFLFSLRLANGIIELDSDGGYKGITVRIKGDTPQTHCSEIIRNLKVSNVIDKKKLIVWR